MKVRQLGVDLERDRLELGALLEIQVVQEVFVVLEEVQVAPGTIIAEGVHADNFLL